MFTKTKQFLTDLNTALWGIADGLMALGAVAAELTIAVRDLTDGLGKITAPLDYLEQDARHHNAKAGISISEN